MCMCFVWCVSVQTFSWCWALLMSRWPTHLTSWNVCCLRARVAHCPMPTLEMSLGFIDSRCALIQCSIFVSKRSPYHSFNRKLSCCCVSRSPKKFITAWFLFLTLFIVIASSRPVNKTVSAGAVVRAKRGTEPGVHKLLENYQTGFGYKSRPTNSW